MDDESVAWGRLILDMAWDFLRRRDADVRRLCRRMIRGRPQVTFEEALSECAERTPMAIAAFDPDHASGASMDTHVLNSLRWYLYKLTRTKVAYEIDKRESIAMMLGMSDSYIEDRSGQETAEQVQLLLAKLTARDRYVLELRYVKEMTLDEVADELNVGRSSAHLAVNVALSNARTICVASRAKS